MDEQMRKIEPQPLQTRQANTLPNPLGQTNAQVDLLKNRDVGIPVNKTPSTATPLQTAGLATNAQQSGFADTGGKVAGSGAPQPTVPDYTNEINAMYEAQRQQQAQALENAYNQNAQTLQNSRAEIAPTYNAQANDLATQYERTRRNNNIQADINGLNTGTASQMALAQQGNYLNAYGQVRAAQANAERAVDQKIADLEVGYKNSVAQALADNDYQKAAALLNEYKRRDEAAKEEQRYQQQIQTAEQKYQDQITRQREQDEFAREQYANQLARQQSQDEFTRQQYADQIARQQQQDAFTREKYEYEKTQAESQQALNDAKQKAAYGDFSGYASLYGEDVANSMQQFWAFNNPDYAYSMGLINDEQYAQATGYYPGSSGYSGSSGGGGGGGYYRSAGSNTPSAEGPGTYNPNGTSPSGNENSTQRTLTPEQALSIAAGVKGGSLVGRELESAYQRYRGLGERAYNEVKKNGVDPNSEEGKAMVNQYIELTWNDPYVSLEDVQSLQTNRNNNAQTAATTHEAKREAQYGKAGTVTYDWNAEQTGAMAEKSAASAQTYKPNTNTGGKVSAGSRTPQSGGASPAAAATYAVGKNLPALKDLWEETKATLFGGSGKSTSNKSTGKTSTGKTTR